MFLIQSEVDGLFVNCMQGMDLLKTMISHLEEQFLHRFLSRIMNQSNRYIQSHKTANYRTLVLLSQFKPSAKVFLQMKIFHGSVC
jgi:hypothetical protein